MMPRNLKILGLALVAMLAMGIVAANASATDKFFHSKAEKTTLTGSQIGVNTFVTDSGTIHCTTASFSGTAIGSSTGGGNFTTQDVEVEPTYTGCRSTGFIEANVTVDVNGCKYTVRTMRTEGGVTQNEDVQLVGCKAGTAGIIVTAPFCTITVTSGQTLSPVSFGNNAGETEITLESNVNNISYHESGFACKNSGSTTTGGTYSGKVLINGKNEAGTQVAIWYT